MSRTNPIPVAHIPTPTAFQVPRSTLRFVILNHREHLVDVARRHLGCLGGDAEDLVQDVCLAALQGEFLVSPDRHRALEDLRREVIAVAKHIADGGAP